MQIETKYRIEVIFNDDRSATEIGVGRPSKVGNELHIKGEDGEETVFNFDLIRSFHIKGLK